MAFTDRIILTGEITHDLFDEVADNAARYIAEASGQKNKSTQLRKYYDELSMWEQKIKQSPDRYNEYLPLIKMLNAKVAYASGRNLVDQNFVDLMRVCLKQLTPEKPEAFKNCKLFFEAFMGFYKVYKPS